MFITTMKQALPYLSKAGVSTLIWSHHGNGKSQAIKQYAEENNFLFKDIRLSTLEVGDFLGLPDFTEDENGKKTSTKFMTPDWLVEVMEYCKANPKSRAVIFLDEINRARRDVLQAAFQLVLDKAFHTTKLPINVDVIAAANPNTEDYIVSDIGDEAFMDRFCHIKLTPSTEEWFKHAEAKGFNDTLIGFLRDQKELLSAKSSEFNIEVKPSRRSWEFVDRLVKADTPMNLLQELCYGIVGQAATIAFIESFKNPDKPISGEDVIKSYPKVRSRMQKYSDVKDGGRIDLIKHTGEALLKLIQERKEDLTKKEQTNICAFLDDVPTDVSFELVRKLYLETICQDMINANKDLLNKFKKAKEITKPTDK
jgi:MoxR-like ATPase